MNKLDLGSLVSSSRARVYLLWAVLVPIGFVLTQYHQVQMINGLWFIIAIIGLSYMFKVMPLRVHQMCNIYLSWLVPIAFGMIVSGLVFHVRGWDHLIAYLGAFWLLVLSVGYTLNGLVDPPSGWYWFAAAINLVAGLLCFFSDAFTQQQYLIAAFISAWSMFNLWLFRANT